MTKASEDPTNAEYWLPPIVWPSGLKLPPSPPRLVYLDLNHWINLSRARAGKGRPGYEGLHQELLARRHDGEIRAVLSGALFREIAKVVDPAQRAHLTSTIEELAGFKYLVGPGDTFRLEVETAMDTRLGQIPRDREVVSLLGDSTLHAFGRRGDLKIEQDGIDVTDHALSTNPKLAQRWPGILREAERLLLAGPQDDEIPALRATGYRPEVPVQTINDNAAFEAAWSKQIDPHRSTHAIRDLVLGRHLSLELLESCIPELQARTIGVEAIASNRAAAREFVMAMPSSCVFVSLLAQLHRQRDHRWQQNDVYDIEALSIAVPYCDIVFTDAAMRSASVNAGLDQHFQTAMPRTPHELVDVLRRG